MTVAAAAAVADGAARRRAPPASRAAAPAMWTPRFRTGEKTAVGLSWMLEEVTGHQTWTWTGDIGTSGSVFRVLPNQNLGVAVMANYDAPRPLNQLAEDIVTIALGGEPPARPSPVNPSDLPAVEPDRRPWDSYVG